MLAQQCQVDEPCRKHKRHQPREKPQNHVPNQPQHLQRVRRAELESAARVERHALRTPESDRHEARGLHGNDRDDQ